ncbi:hypothetical protein [Patulibacter sp. SYSU D01012]|uniref:hypothetical protein n=1 Tax=Patulibacter sp. SYSU D01012 TaxID=2817381 RepID=UPI001B302ABB|nr:hypothetical protein [Patulibacter sp. SYSU D01012]
MRAIRPSSSPARAAVLGAVAACLTAATPAVAAPAPASGRLVLDPSPVVGDVAAQGGTVAWTSGDAAAGGSGSAYRLLVRDPGASAVRRVDVRLPAGTNAVSVGTDRRGRPVALLGTPARTWSVPLAADARPVVRPVAGSARWRASALFRGRLAYARERGGRTQVLVAPRPGAAGRIAFAVPRRYAVAELALAADGTVFVHGRRRTRVGALDVLWRARVGSAAREVLRQSSGGASDNGMGRPTVIAGGARVTVSRWALGGGHPRDLTTFSVRTGRVLATAPIAQDPGADAVEQLGLDHGESVVRTVVSSGCSVIGGPDASRPPCLGVTLLTPAARAPARAAQGSPAR